MRNCFADCELTPTARILFDERLEFEKMIGYTPFTD
jgi:hypothetical protein